MNRRKALVTLGFTALSGVAWSIPGLRGLEVSEAVATQAIDDRLRNDLTRRKQRINSEEGIAMFLYCDNLVPGSPAPQVTEFNSQTASAFQETAEAFQRLQPNAAYKDVAQVIEIIAARDFARGASEVAQ